jgi:hypothetical protein
MLLVAILFIESIAPAAAYTVYAPEPGSCRIIGDPDVYGIGIRLCYYLQWVATILASWIAPEQNSIARTSANTVTLGVLASNFRSAQHGSLIAVEWYIVLWMTFVLSATNLPKRSEISGSFSLSVQLLLWSVKLLAQPWVYFRAFNTGHKDGCSAFVFLFAKINVYHNGWRIFGKVASILGVVVVVGVFLPLAVYFFYAGVRSKYEGDESFARPVIYQATTTTILKLALGAISIAVIEMTIKVNSVDLSAGPLYSGGQLIPFVVGLVSIFATFVGACSSDRLT